MFKESRVIKLGPFELILSRREVESSGTAQPELVEGIGFESVSRLSEEAITQRLEAVKHGHQRIFEIYCDTGESEDLIFAPAAIGKAALAEAYSEAVDEPMDCMRFYELSANELEELRTDPQLLQQHQRARSQQIRGPLHWEV